MHIVRTISLDKELDAQIEEARGNVPRSLWYRLAAEAKLDLELARELDLELARDRELALERKATPKPAPKNLERASKKRPTTAERTANQRARDARKEREARQAKLNKAKGM